MKKQLRSSAGNKKRAMKRAIRSRCSQGEMSFTCVCPRIFGDPWLLEKHLSWHSAISLAMLARGDSENRSSWLCSTDGSGKSRIPKPFLLTVLPILKQSEDVGSLQARTTTLSVHNWPCLKACPQRTGGTAAMASLSSFYQGQCCCPHFCHSPRLLNSITPKTHTAKPLEYCREPHSPKP